MDAYIFQADMECEDCIRDWLMSRDEVLLAFPDINSGGAHLISTEAMFRELLIANGRDPDCESTWDSDEFPKGPYRDGGGEADSPQHCNCCQVFLENPLTSDGYSYVLEQLQQHGHGNAYVRAEWLAYYGDDHMEDGRSIRDVLEGDEEEECDEEEESAPVEVSPFDHLRDIAEQFRS